MTIENDLQEEINCLQQQNSELQLALLTVKTKAIDDITWNDMTKAQRKNFLSKLSLSDLLSVIEYEIGSRFVRDYEAGEHIRNLLKEMKIKIGATKL